MDTGNVSILPTHNCEKFPVTTPPYSPSSWQIPLSVRTGFSSLRKSVSWRTSREDQESVPDEEKVIVRNLQAYPRGYPNLASFLDSDENFGIYRRFGYLQSRLLLEKQDELRLLEEELEYTEKNLDEALLSTREQPEEYAKSRKELFSRIEIAYNEYANLLCAAQGLTAMNRPSTADYRSVVNYLVNIKPTRKAERSFIRHKEDLVTLRPGREHAWLDTVIEHTLRFFHCGLVEYLFCSRETRMKTEPFLQDSDNCQSERIAVYYTRSRIDVVVNCIVGLMVLLLLVVPIYVLFHLLDGSTSNRAYSISVGVLLVFILVFSGVLHLFTRAQRHEILGAAAAYCAVLVVFLGNFGNFGASGTR